MHKEALLHSFWPGLSFMIFGTESVACPMWAEFIFISLYSLTNVCRNDFERTEFWFGFLFILMIALDEMGGTVIIRMVYRYYFIMKESR